MSLSDELDDRTAQRLKIAALFKARPLEDITADELRAVTPHYQQRISELRRKSQMTIRNVPQSFTDALGRVHKMDGSYRWYPHGETLGRDAGEIVGRPWDYTGPFAAPEPFKLV